MATEIKTYCDRCKKQFEYVYHGHIRGLDPKYFFKTFDLCPSCKDKVIDFITKGTND